MTGLVQSSQIWDILRMDQQIIMAVVDQRRRRLRFSVSNLSKCAEVSRATYYRWLAGLSSPSLQDLAAIAGALDAVEAVQA